MLKNDATAMSECTVQLWYNKYRVKKNGNASLYLQIIVGGEHHEIRLKALQWPAKFIDIEKKILLPRSKNDADLLTFNAIIERERAKYWGIVLGFLKKDIAFRLADIFAEANFYQRGNLFCEFMEQAIRDRQRTTVKKDMIKHSTAKGHHSTLNWFRDFLKHGDIEISTIDDRLLERFAHHLTPHMEDGSVWTKIRNIKAYLGYAFRNKIAINHDYKRFSITAPEPDPTWLLEHELNALLNLYQGRGPFGEQIVLKDEQRKNLRAFLFASFTGLRVSDLARWNKDWIKNGTITFIPLKNRKSNRNPKPVIIPIIPIARTFILDLKSETFEITTDQVYNRGLKTLAILAGLDKNLTSHVARHTFATWLAIEGVPPLVISKLLGHKSQVTTMIYIHLAEEFLAREMIKVQNRFTLPGRY